MPSNTTFIPKHLHVPGNLSVEGVVDLTNADLDFGILDINNSTNTVTIAGGTNDTPLALTSSDANCRMSFTDDNAAWAVGNLGSDWFGIKDLTANLTPFWIDNGSAESSLVVLNGAIAVNTATQRLTAKLTIFGASDSLAVTDPNNASKLVIIENSTDALIAFEAPNNALCGLTFNAGTDGDYSMFRHVYTGSAAEFRFRLNNAEALAIKQNGIINFVGTMGNSTKDPTTDAPADWVQVEIGGTAYYLPAYAAS